MTQFSAPRRALVDLPINTFGTPTKTNNPEKAAGKRSIDLVTDPEYPTPRVKMSPVRSQENSKIDGLLPKVSNPVYAGNLEAYIFPESCHTTSSRTCLAPHKTDPRRRFGGCSGRDGRSRLADQLRLKCGFRP